MFDPRALEAAAALDPRLRMDPPPGVTELMLVEGAANLNDVQGRAFSEEYDDDDDDGDPFAAVNTLAPVSNTGQALTVIAPKVEVREEINTPSAVRAVNVALPRPPFQPAPSAHAPITHAPVTESNAESILKEAFACILGSASRRKQIKIKINEITFSFSAAMVIEAPTSIVIFSDKDVGFSLPNLTSVSVFVDDIEHDAICMNAGLFVEAFGATLMYFTLYSNTQENE